MIPSLPRFALRDILLLLALVALYLSVVRPFFGVTADDAYISFRYSQNWAHGCGPRYNCGEPAVEGYTNFLWMALGALFMKMGLNIVVAIRFVGLLSGAAGIAAIFLLSRRLHRGCAASAALAGLALAASPYWAVNSVAGLETAAAAAVILLATALSLDLPGARRPWIAGAVWGLAYMIRPEGLVLGAVTGGWLLLACLLGRRGVRHTVLQGLKYGAGVLAVAGPFLAWRVAYYGSIYPNTYLAKRAPLERVLASNLKVLGNSYVFFLALIAGALVVFLLRRELRLQLPLLLAGVSAAISLSVHNNFWMPGHRLYLTAAALTAVVAAGLGRYIPVTDEGGRGPIWRWLAAVPALGLTAALLWAAWQAQPGTVDLARLHYARDNNEARAMGLRLRKKAVEGDWLATRDAGMVPFFAGPMLKVLDTHERSLNDRRIALKGWNPQYIMNHNPRWIIFASTLRRPFWLTHRVEGYIWHMAGFHERYVETDVAMWHRLRYFYLYEKLDRPRKLTGPPPAAWPMRRPPGPPPKKVEPKKVKPKAPEAAPPLKVLPVEPASTPAGEGG